MAIIDSKEEAINWITRKQAEKDKFRRTKWEPVIKTLLESKHECAKIKMAKPINVTEIKTKYPKVDVWSRKINGQIYLYIAKKVK